MTHPKISQLPSSLVNTQLETLFTEETQKRKRAIARGATEYDVESTFFLDDPGDADVIVGSAIGPSNARAVALDPKKKDR